MKQNKEFKKKKSQKTNTTQNPSIDNHKDILLKKIPSYSIPFDPTADKTNTRESNRKKTTTH